MSLLPRLSPDMQEGFAFLIIKDIIQDQSLKQTWWSSRSAVPISDISLKYSFESHWCLVRAVVSFCLSLTSCPAKTRNTGLLKGHSLFASWLLLRQMFQGTTEDINTCTLGEKKGVQVFKQCQTWKNSNSLPSPLIWQFQGTKRVKTCTQSTFRSGEFRQGLH